MPGIGSPHSIEDNGHTYHFDPRNLPYEVMADYSRMLASGKIDNKFIADELIPALQDLEQRTNYIDADKHRDRATESILDSYAKGTPIIVLSGSSSSVSATSEYATSNAQSLCAVYGISPRNFPDYAGQSQFFYGPGSTDSLGYTTIVRDPQDSAGEYKHVNFSFTDSSRKVSEDGWDAALTFLDHYKSDITAAVDQLHARHNWIDKNLLHAAFLKLCLLELTTYAGTDISQDVAASGMTHSNYATAYENEFTGFFSPVDSFLATSWGQSLYQGVSANTLDVSAQGFGPVQVIPKLALAADAPTRAAFQPAGRDWTKQNDVIASTFDPAEMFLLKAMTWSTQLAQIEKNGGVDLPIVNAPHIKNDELSKQLATVILADQLVQLPDMTVEHIPQMLAGFAISDYLTECYQISALLGVNLRLPGIAEYTEAVNPSHYACDSSGLITAGYFYTSPTTAGAATTRTCLATDPIRDE